MKMLCIKGRLHPAHTGLRAGQVYEVWSADCCACSCYPVVHAEGVRFYKPMKLRCKRCGRRVGIDIYPRWSPRRFIPFDPDKVADITEKEANDLYLTKELVT